VSEATLNFHHHKPLSDLIFEKIKTARKHGIAWAIRERFIPYFLWLCLHFILLVIYPFKSVKVILLRTDRIGHLAYNTDIFLRKILSRKGEWGQYYCVFIISPEIANQQLWKMYQREIASIWNYNCVLITNKLLSRIFDRLKITESTSYFENCHWLFDFDYPYYKFGNPQPLLHFTPAEEKQGKKIMGQMGLDRHCWFICFHSRDTAFEASLASKPKGLLLGHIYRNAEVKTYLEAAEYIASCGGYAVRMGSVVAEKISNITPPRIIDYSFTHRSDFGDIYLISKAKFFLGNSAGIFFVATIFGVPLALANFVPLEVLTPFREGDLFITKKIWSYEKGRLLTFREILEIDQNRYANPNQNEFRVIDNTAEEIRELAQEMNERLDGTFSVTKEDNELQKEFHSIFKPHHLCYGTVVRIGAKFIRDNKELLA